MSELLEANIRDEIWSHDERILGQDDSGHGVDHVRRVHATAMDFADKIDVPIDKRVVELAALLHDVDDYKLVGLEQAERLTNAFEIMDASGVDNDTQLAVRGIISSMGYRNSLKGIRPTSIEGKVVSDADMCDAIGASGIIRALTYAVSGRGTGVVFDRTVWPLVDISAEQYNGSGSTHDTDSFINHFFEKLLKLRGMMMTEPGREEAAVRDEQMVSFLRAYFREEGAPEWSEFLERYIQTR